MTCPECDGTGEKAVTYADLQGFPYDVDHAMRKAGTVCDDWDAELMNRYYSPTERKESE